MRALAAIVLLGGGLSVLPTLTAQGCAQETFWHRLAPAASPSARHGHSMTFDSTRGKVVLFGGRSQDQEAGQETWVWGDGSWTRLNPPMAPEARFGARMVFDDITDRTVLFGGLRGDDLPFADTWTWDGSTWTRLETRDSPEGRCGHGMVYDPKRERVFLYGGMDPNLDPSHFDGTWVLDRGGSTWLRLTGSKSPGPRAWHAMAYDGLRNTIVLFGGEMEVAPGLYEELGDTWIWRDDRWQQVFPTNSPPAQQGHAMTWDAGRGCIVLFGRDQTWEWDGTDWFPTAAGAPVPQRRSHAMVYQPVPGRVLMFGGLGVQEYGDTWEYLRVALDPAYDLLGRGCQGTAGVPTLDAAEAQAPWVGEPFTAVADNLPLHQPALMALGFQEARWVLVQVSGDSPVSTPCMVYVDPALLSWMVEAGPGRSAWTVLLPADPAAVGLVFYNQVLVADPQANYLGVTTTNARIGRIGGVR